MTLQHTTQKSLCKTQEINEILDTVQLKKILCKLDVPARVRSCSKLEDFLACTHNQPVKMRFLEQQQEVKKTPSVTTSEPYLGRLLVSWCSREEDRDDLVYSLERSEW